MQMLNFSTTNHKNIGNGYYRQLQGHAPHADIVSESKSRNHVTLHDVVKAPYNNYNSTQRSETTQWHWVMLPETQTGNVYTSASSTNSPQARVERTDTCRCGRLFVYDLISFDSAAKTTPTCSNKPRGQAESKSIYTTGKQTTVDCHDTQYTVRRWRPLSAVTEAATAA